MRAVLVALAAAFAIVSPALAEPPVWVVRDRDSEMVIFGSVHLLPAGLDWRPPALTRAILRADDLWFELPASEDTAGETGRLAARIGMLPPDQSLFRLLGRDAGQRLSRVAQSLQVDPLSLDRMEPWFAEVALVGGAYRTAGATSQQGVEAQVQALAPPRVRRRALETAAQQVALLDQTPPGEQIAALNQTVRELEADPEGYRRLVRAWMAGDLQALRRQALDPLRTVAPTLFDRLVTERNARWTQALDQRLKGRGRTVVIVGVGHLVGTAGVPDQLRALGYSVKGP
jgi:uncharacterized protein